MKFSLLLLLAALTAHSQDICELEFVRSTYTSKSKNFEEGLLKNLDNAYKFGLKQKDPVNKMDSIDEQYDILRDLFRTYRKTKLNELQALNLPQAEINEQLEKHVVKFFHENKKYIDQLLNSVDLIFKSTSLPVKKVQRQVGALKYDAFLLFTNEAGTKISLKTLKRYQKRFGVDLISFDLIENIGSSMEAAFYREAKRVELGVNGIRSIVVENRIPMIPKHEFHHAAFESKRAMKGKSENNNSIYNLTFSAFGEKPLSDGAYGRYMSAEEVYNWANNSFWGSGRLLKSSEHNTEDVITDVLTIFKYLPETKALAEETVNLTKRLDNGYKAMLREVEDKTFELLLLNGDSEMARTLSEARYIMVPDVKSKIHIREFLGPEYKKEVATILENRKKIEIDLAQSKTENLSAEALHDLQVLKENELSRDSFIHIINTLKNKNSKLQKVSSVLSAESDVVINKTQMFLDKIKQAKESTGNLPELDHGEVRELAVEYRRLGNLVKEDYKGFAGR